MAEAVLASHSICPLLQVLSLEPQVLHDQALVNEGIEYLSGFAVLDLLPHQIHLSLLHLVQHERLQRLKDN